MATAYGVSGINLLPKDSFEFSTLGKVLKWVTTAGRILVVITEFVVLLAFASRFYFDKKLDDLGEVLAQKEAQIEAYASVETEMRKIFTKQSTVEMFKKDGLNFSLRVDQLTAILPSGMTLDSLTLNSSGITVAGKAQSEFAFAQFVGGVKKMPGVVAINMKDTNFDQTTGGVKFGLQISYK